MAASVTVKQETTKQKTYNVEGSSLREIYDSMTSNAPSGGCGVGQAETPLSAPSIDDYEEEQADKPLKKGQETWIVRAKKVELVLSPEITLPALKSDKALSEPAKKEWARFLKAVASHEQDHVDTAAALADAISAEVAALEGIGSGKDKKAALKAADTDFVKQYKAMTSGGKFAKRMQAAHDRLDGGGNRFMLNDVE
jgi:predicted secreted Zn-dependent protease